MDTSRNQTDSYRVQMVSQRIASWKLKMPASREGRVDGRIPVATPVVPRDPSLRSCRPDKGCIRSLPKHQSDKQPSEMSCLGWQIESALNVAVLDGNKLKVVAKGSAPTG